MGLFDRFSKNKSKNNLSDQQPTYVDLVEQQENHLADMQGRLSQLDSAPGIKRATAIAHEEASIFSIDMNEFAIKNNRQNYLKGSGAIDDYKLDELLQYLKHNETLTRLRSSKC